MDKMKKTDHKIVCNKLKNPLLKTNFTTVVICLRGMNTLQVEFIKTIDTPPNYSSCGVLVLLLIILDLVQQTTHSPSRSPVPQHYSLSCIIHLMTQNNKVHSLFKKLLIFRCQQFQASGIVNYFGTFPAQNLQLRVSLTNRTLSS